MKKVIFLLTTVVLVTTVSLPAQTEAETKAWQAYMAPGEPHHLMATYIGEWVDEMTFWMTPDSPPTKMTTNTTTEMIMGGRYQLSKSVGTMMGMPFEGMALVGYDNAKKMATTVWVDNFGTGTLAMEGPWDEATRSITFTGKMTDPMSGKENQVRQLIRFIDNDHQEMEMYDTKSGKESKTMHMLSTRKK